MSSVITNMESIVVVGPAHVVGPASPRIAEAVEKDSDKFCSVIHSTHSTETKPNTSILVS